MDNILYVGPYREFSGMGNAARQYIKALIHSGANVSVRPSYNIFKPLPSEEIDNEILEAESNFSKSYHKVIQHCYPHQVVLDKRFGQNIGIVHVESIGYHNNIAQHLNILDNIVVGSNFCAKSLMGAGVDPSKIRIIPEPIDLAIISDYKENNKPETKDSSFCFYTISDFIDRKNLIKLITAYSLVCDQNEDIELVIKLKGFANTDIHISESVDYALSKIYSTIRRSYMKKPKIILGETKYDAILYIHNNNDCFINVSSGESFGYSTLEAMSFNNNIIVNKNIASAEILDENCGNFVDTSKTECFDSDRLYYLYNTINQQWESPSIPSLVQNMFKSIYESKDNKHQRIEAQTQAIKKYDMETVSEQMRLL
jgi:glycosyltransferase involved in cell wall biosynthesis